VFRALSYQQVGAASILSRAVGGLARGRRCLLFALPGSLNAVQTAWEGIFKLELAHLVYETVR
jgi:molybdenum cofactor biosynthesis protein B